MRFTRGQVREIADATETVTGGAFKFGYVSSPGDGVRYVDGVRQLVWFGRNAARQAAAYYTAGAVRWAELSGTEEVPEVIRQADEVLKTAGNPGVVRKAYAEGAETAAARFEVRAPSQG